MFKVGDKVVLKKGRRFLAVGVVVESKRHTSIKTTEGTRILFNTEHLRLATKEEEVLGRRIDKRRKATVSQNVNSLEDLRDCDTSPNCKKYER